MDLQFIASTVTFLVIVFFSILFVSLSAHFSNVCRSKDNENIEHADIIDHSEKKDHDHDEYDNNEKIKDFLIDLREHGIDNYEQLETLKNQLDDNYVETLEELEDLRDDIERCIRDLRNHKIDNYEQIDDLLDRFNDIGVDTVEELENLLNSTKQDIPTLTDDHDADNFNVIVVSEHKKEITDSDGETHSEKKKILRAQLCDRPKYARPSYEKRPRN